MFLESSYRVLSGYENNAIVTEMSKVTMCWTPIICHFYDVICSPGYVDLLTQLAILRSHWKTSGNVYVAILQRPLPLLNKETVQVMVWTVRQIGVIKSPQVVICGKKFFGSLNFFCEKFPIKHCSRHNMWIRWSFFSISSSYFHRNIVYIWIFAHPRLTTYQLDWTRMLYKQK